jgi:hypothetical protein
MPGADDTDHVQIVLFDQAIEMNIDKIQSGCRTPMAQQPRLYVFAGQWDFEQWIILKINLADGEIVRGAPVGIHVFEKRRRERRRCRGFRERCCCPR